MSCLAAVAFLRQCLRLTPLWPRCAPELFRSDKRGIEVFRNGHRNAIATTSRGQAGAALPFRRSSRCRDYRNQADEASRPNIEVLTNDSRNSALRGIQNPPGGLGMNLSKDPPPFCSMLPESQD